MGDRSYPVIKSFLLLAALAVFALVVLGLFARSAHAQTAPGTSTYGWYNPYDSTAGMFSTGAGICLYYQNKNSPGTTYAYAFVDHGNGTGECDQTIGSTATKMVGLSYKAPSCASSGTGTFAFQTGWFTAAQQGTGEFTGAVSLPTDGSTYSDGTCAVLYTNAIVSQCVDSTAPSADGLYSVTCTFSGSYTGAALAPGASAYGAADPGCPGTVGQVNGVTACTVVASGGGGASGVVPASGATVITGAGSVVAVKGPSTGGQYGGDADILGTDPDISPSYMGSNLPSPTAGGDPFATLTGLAPGSSDLNVTFAAVTCPQATFSLFGQDFVMDSQCTLLAQFADQIKAVMLVCFAFTSLLIVLRA